jgi:hypothetical protein
MLKHMFWEYNYVLFLIEKINFDNFNWGSLCKKLAVANWNFGNISVVAGRERKTCVKMAGHRTFQTHTDCFTFP